MHDFKQQQANTHSNLQQKPTFKNQTFSFMFKTCVNKSCTRIQARIAKTLRNGEPNPEIHDIRI